MMTQRTNGWVYIGNKGSFMLENPDRNSYLYFPLVNEAGMMSTITSSLHGQVTSGQNTFLMAPLSVEDLHNSKASLNFWVHIKGKGVWSAAGNSPQQNAARFSEREERTFTPSACRCLFSFQPRMNGRLKKEAECTPYGVHSASFVTSD
jgi:cellobiose phosphorylase